MNQQPLQDRNSLRSAPFSTDSPAPLDEVMSTAVKVTGCLAAFLVASGHPGRIIASSSAEVLKHLGLSLFNPELRTIIARSRTEDAWGVSLHQGDLARTMSVLPAGETDAGDALLFCVVSESASLWTATIRASVSAFVPLIAAIAKRSCDQTCDAHQEAFHRGDLRQALLDSVSDCVWMKDRDSRYVEVNDAVATLNGISIEQMLGTTDYDHFPRDVAEHYIRDDRQVLNTGSPLSFVESSIDAFGELRWFETVKTPVRDRDGSIIAIAGVARDVTLRQELETDRHRLIQELAQQRDRLSDMVANVPGVVWEENFDGSSRFVSEQIETILGYTVEEYMQRFSSFLDVVHPDDCAEVLRSNEEIIAARKGMHAFRMIRKDGTQIWCESHCRVIFDSRGRAVGLRGIAVDVTTRRAAEERLRASEAHFRSLADVTPVMIWTTDASGGVQFQNRRILDFIGASPGEAHGDLWKDWIHPEDRDRVVQTLSESHASTALVAFEVRARRYDGEYRDLLVDAVPRFAAGGNFDGFAGSCVDLTDRRRLERRLEEERKLAGLGRLAATIAHEINNVLMAIQPFADVMRREPSPQLLSRAADHITTSIQRGRRITHDILRFARTADPVCEPILMCEWLPEVEEELKLVAGPGVILEFDIDADVCIDGDRHQLMQVLTSLTSNARDAMGETGVLTISANLEESWPGLPAGDGPFAHVVVSDTGPGIPEDALDRLFEPLFTTKKSGTGLGLPIVREIVRRHQGDVIVHNSPDSGAVFHLLLRATSDRPVHQLKLADLLPDTARRILLVEDDEMVAFAVAELLELEGRQVSVASRGAHALDAIAQHRPDIVVLDIGLPDIPGTEVFAMIRTKYPMLPVLFSSGHAGELDVDLGRLSGPTAHLLKPYEISTMIASIRNLMERAATMACEPATLASDS